MKKRNEQLHFLVNITNGRCYSQDYLTEDEAISHNQWIVTYGSQNIRWLTPDEFAELQRRVLDL